MKALDYRDTPAVWVDLDIAERNIRNAAERLGKYGIAHRPHVKAHKSLYFAGLQQNLGCRGVTCAKLGEAEAMAEGGIEDILIAFPLIGERKLLRYRQLAESVPTLRTIVNSREGAEGLSRLGEEMGKKLEVLVELDGGIGRGGLLPGEALREFGEALRGYSGISVVGVLYYGGDIYGCRTEDAVRARVRRERDDILAAAETLRACGHQVRICSGGSSFSVDFPEEMEGITELRAGNYLFNDTMRLSFGLIGMEDCALRVAVTVVARPDAYSCIVDAGSKTLAMDLAMGREGYGMAAEAPDAIIWKLNEEHGYLRSSSPMEFAVGDRMTIIPNHACVIPNLAGVLYGMRGGECEVVIPVEAAQRSR